MQVRKMQDKTAGTFKTKTRGKAVVTGDAGTAARIVDLLGGIYAWAEKPDARSHDLRRTFASVAADEGYGDATIGERLGHARRGVTARHYIRRPDAALIAAVDRVARRIKEQMTGSEAAEVVPLPVRRA